MAYFFWATWYVLYSGCMCMCCLPICEHRAYMLRLQLSEIGVEVRFILDDLLSADLNRLIQQAGDNQMEAIRHRAAVSVQPSVHS